MYYIVYGLLYSFSLLPFFILYGIGDVIAFTLFTLLGYRKKVVMANLGIAFPEKTEQERLKIARQFYRNFTDTFMETLKLLSLSERQISKRGLMDVSEVLPLIQSGKNIQIMGGHQMNWEFVNLAVAEKINISWVGIYLRINNKIIDKIIYRMRSRRGTVLVAAHEFVTLRNAVFNRQYAIGLAADQNPGNLTNVYWLNYFGRPAPFFSGPDKSARANNIAVVFVNMVKVKRGYYKFVPEIFSREGSQLKEKEFTLCYRNFMERIIRQQPANYLWSHKRWKWGYREGYHWIDHSPEPAFEEVRSRHYN